MVDLLLKPIVERWVRLPVERWNLLADPSFDSGGTDYLQSWEEYNGSGSVTITPNSITKTGTRWGYLAQNYSLEVSLGANSAVSIGNRNFIPVNLVDDYQVLLYALGGRNVTLQLMVKYYSSGLVHIETQYNQYTGGWSWSPLRGVSVPPPNAAYARFAVRLSTGSNSSIIWIDDAAMYPVNIPLIRTFKTWNNTSGTYDLTLSKNMIRIYHLMAHNYGSSGTQVYIEPNTNVPAGMLAGLTCPGNSTVTLVCNPPVHCIDRPYPTVPWKINSRLATGDLFVAVVYFNGMDYWTTSDL
jgi:hypothetical protein